jgi:hypothetical protein
MRARRQQVLSLKGTARSCLACKCIRRWKMKKMRLRALCFGVVLLVTSSLAGPRTSARDSAEPRSPGAHNLFLVSPVAFSAAPFQERWSGWNMSNESFIEWRWKAHTNEPYIDPDCEFEFRTTNGQKMNFRYEASYDSLFTRFPPLRRLTQ